MHRSDMFSTPVVTRPIERQLAAVAESVLVHVLGFALLLLAMSETRLRPAGGTRPGPPLEIFVVSPREPAGSAGLQPLPSEAEAFLPITDPPSDLSIARLSLNLRKISAHATLLFPFVTPGLALERFFVVPSRSLSVSRVLESLVRDHPGTKASTELLLLLDAIALGSVEDLLALITIDPKADLQATLRTDVRAYALAVKIQEYYKDALTKKGLTTEVVIRAYYDRIRLALLDRPLASERSRWRAFSYERLKRFGYRSDSY